MDAVDALRAMKDGRVIRRRCRPALELRLHEDRFEARYGKGNWDANYMSLQTFLDAEDWEVVEEYPLTFGEAIAEAMKGRLVANETCPEIIYRMRNGVLEYLDADGVHTDDLCKGEIEAGWRVIETRTIEIR